MKVNHPANDGLRYPVKGILSFNTKGCGLLIPGAGSLYTIMSKLALTKNVNASLEPGGGNCWLVVSAW